MLTSVRHLLLCGLLLLTAHGFAASPIVIAEGHYRKGFPSQTSLSKQATNVERIFRNNNIKTDLIRETALSAKTLKGARMVILPYNPTLLPKNLEALKDFTQKGGKIMAFFSRNDKLCQLLGLKQGTYVPGEKFGNPDSIQTLVTDIAGLPQTLPQASWNGVTLIPASPETRVLGQYLNAQKKPTGFNAITQSPNGFMFSHILISSNHPSVAQTILALTATAVPEIWRQTTQQLLQDLQTVGGATSLKDFEERIPDAFRPQCAKQLERIRLLQANAEKHFQEKNYNQAYPMAKEAMDMARDIYLRTRRSRPGELRGAWIHSAYGIKGESWDETIKNLKANGFNAIFVNFLWGYVADYDSKVLPVHPDVKRRGDQIALCLKACKKYGVELHAWKVCWNMGHRTPKNLRDKMAKQKRIQLTLTGEPTRYLAPHLKENQDLEVNAFVELVTKYQLDGIHLDYIRYPDQKCDFSDSARKAFEAFNGKPVRNWPQDCALGGKLRKKFNQWRRNNISQTVERIAREVRQANPKAKISAAVFGHWDDTKNSIAQDTETWIRNGWLDFVCPMDYTTSNRQFIALVTRQVQVAKPQIPVYPGIGSFRISDAAKVAEQIELARKLGADGFVCFDLSYFFAHRTLPNLRLGATSTDALPPFPHHSPKLDMTLAPSQNKLLTNEFAFPETVTANLTFINAKPPKFFKVRLLRDGHFITPAQPKIHTRLKGSTLTCTFIPPEPGTYRIELSDDRTFASMSRNIPVLSPEDLRQRKILQGIPQFARNGKPRVAVWQHNAYGCPGITKALRDSGLFDVAPLFNLKPATLAACQAVILPQPRENFHLFHSPKTAQTLRDYVRQGGTLLVTHALVGIRDFPVICPALITEVNEKALATNRWKPNPSHPIMAGIPNQTQFSTFFDMVSMTPGKNAQPIIFDQTGKIVGGVAGQDGKGRFVAIGLGLGITRGDADTDLTDVEQKLLVNALKWMLKP